MATHRKSYFLAPNFDYPPNGPIALGNIICDPCYPAESLLVTSTKVRNTAVSEPEIYTSKVEGWQDIRSAHKDARLGVWARFLDTVDTSIEGHRQKTSWQDYKCDEMETQYFLPDPDYLQARIAEPRVKQVMEMRRLGHRKAVYLITGVKIAKGLTIETGAGRERGFDADASVDMTALSAGTVPIGVGAGAGRKTGSDHKATAKIVGDCTFAYQLCRLRFTSIGKDLQADFHRKGVFCGIDDGEIEDLKLEISHNLGDAGIEDLEEEIDDEIGVAAIDLDEQEPVRCIAFTKQLA